MVSRVVLIAVGFLLSGSGHAQKASPVPNEMESSVSAYWSTDDKAVASRKVVGSIEDQIFRNHVQSLVPGTTSKSAKAKQQIDDVVAYALAPEKGYHRVSCSDRNCEIVIVLPYLDGGSRNA